MSQYFIDKLVYNNDTLDIHDTEAREMIANNTTNIQAVSARVTKNANDIDALEKITTDLREDVDNLDDRMGVAETEIDGLKTRTTNLEGRMNTAENRLDGHDTKISNLENRMDTAEYNIVALDGRMEAAERGIDAVEGRLDLVEAKNDEQDIAIDDLEENVAKNTADIVDIKDDLTGVHEDIEDLDDRITASTYEAGIGIYFGQGREHTNINVEDELLDQINQNTIDIQNLKTRVTNVENRLATVEGDITDIKGDIVTIQNDITSIRGDITSIQNDITNIRGDITSIQNDITSTRGDITTINNKITQIENDIDALDARITALEGKVLPSGGTTGQILRKKSDTDFDVEWGDEDDISALDARITALEGKVLPSGGTTGQILRKKSDTDFDAEWGDEDDYQYYSEKTTPNISDFVNPGSMSKNLIFEGSSVHSGSSDLFSFLPFANATQGKNPTWYVKRRCVNYIRSGSSRSFTTDEAVCYVDASGQTGSNHRDTYAKFMRTQTNAWDIVEGSFLIGILDVSVNYSTFTFTPDANNGLDIFMTAFANLAHRNTLRCKVQVNYNNKYEKVEFSIISASDNNANWEGSFTVTLGNKIYTVKLSYTSGVITVSKVNIGTLA